MGKLFMPTRNIKSVDQARGYKKRAHPIWLGGEDGKVLQVMESGMARRVEELEREIRSLSDDERIHLLRDLVVDLDGERDPEAERAWLEEAQRRFRDLKEGVVEAIPAEDVFKSARDRLKK